MKFAQIVMGPAGSGKSTYCRAVQEHCDAIKRSIHLVNLDPAAEDLLYEPSIDVRELISVDDAMVALDYGMEYLEKNVHWLEEKLGDYDEDYIVIDCPGQIELYTHLSVMKTLIAQLQRWNYNICAVYLVDSVTMSDATRFISSTLICLSAMVHMELPHVNVMSKCDLLSSMDAAKKYQNPDMMTIVDELNEKTDERFRGLNEAFGRLIDEYSMVSFVPLSVSDEESVQLVLQHVDHAIQYGEDMEPKSPRDYGDDSKEEE